MAVEGLADTGRARAFPLVLRAARTGTSEFTIRALTAVGVLAERDEEACRPGVGGCMGNFPSGDRDISPLCSQCGKELRRPQADRLAREVARWLDSSDADVREAAIETLGKIAAPAALPALKSLVADPKRKESHAAAREASARIEKSRWR